MIKEAIEKIESLVPEMTEEEDYLGRQYFGYRGILSPIKPALPETIQLNTLDGIVDFITEEKHKCSVHITGAQGVQVISALEDDWKRRSIFARTSITDSSFNFNRPMSIETFIVSLQCYFLDTETKKKVIDYVSSITSSEVSTADDSGIAQNVTVKNEIGRKEAIDFDPLVTLAPYRTFREIEQPTDKFLLRMTQQEKGLPTVTLHEAGGDLWEHTAIESIYKYLREKLSEEIAIIR